MPDDDFEDELEGEGDDVLEGSPVPPNLDSKPRHEVRSPLSLH